MRILVTGGAGFIGSHIVTALAAEGHEPVVLDTRPRPAARPDGPGDRPDDVPGGHQPGDGPADRPDDVPGGDRPGDVPGGEVRAGAGAGEAAGSATPWLHADVRDRAALAHALRGVDAVCHQAAMVGLGKDFADAPDYVSRNDLGTATLLAAMAGAGVRDLVLAGSMVVYGEGRYDCDRDGPVRPGPREAGDLEAGRFEPVCPACGDALRPGLVTEDAPVDPRNVYAATKVAQEHLAAAWARTTGGRAISLRYHNVYGPGMPRDTPYAGVASFFRSALERGEQPRVFEDGGQRRDFVHVRDVAAANAVALAALTDGPATGGFRAYNTGSGRPHTVGEMAAALASARGGPAPMITGEYRLGDVRHVTASSERLMAELGWRPRVGFADGMAEFARASMSPPSPATPAASAPTDGAPAAPGAPAPTAETSARTRA